ncbi:MAG: VWA domain-containing protein [Terriglobales bacterium]
MLNRFIAAVLITAIAVPPLLAQQAKPAQQKLPSQTLYRFKAESELVLVNVIARDKDGNPVRNLTKDDFTVMEDGKPQKVQSFDLEQTDLTPVATPVQAVLAAPKANEPAPAALPEKLDLRDRRLVVLFFDLSSMQPDDIDRAVEAGQKFVNQQMTASDLVGVISLGSSLVVNQDFTSDRAQLDKVLAALSPTTGAGFEAGSTGDTEDTPDTGQDFTADDSEYNVFNTDRRLEALQAVAESLSRIEQKKSIVYFSSGLDGTGAENQAQLRNAVNRAIQSNVAIYPMDMRGLQAVIPGGSATQASLRGTGSYSGRAQESAFNSQFSSQETLVTLAEDTGGRAFLDTNDFNSVFKRVEEDTATYYVLGYRSSNPLRDGRYRHITVKTRVPGLKLEFRHGYYAPRDFLHSGHEDREQMLVDELSSDLPSTDLDVYLSAAYFRTSDNRFWVPVTLVVPGSQIPFVKGGDKDKATLDIIGVVRDELKRPVGNIRDTVKLNLDESQEVRRKNVQYETGFSLPSGNYHLKFVLRENQTGQVGSFETDINVPDMKKSPLRVSSVLLASQIQAAPKKKTENILVHDGKEIVPNVTHVFAANQQLYFYYEVYEPKADKQNIHLLTSIEFLRGKTKVYETPVVEAKQLTAPNRKAAIFQLDVPASQLKPGYYTCQVNVIDDAAGTFAFPRVALLVRNAPTPTATPNKAPGD